MLKQVSFLQSLEADHKMPEAKVFFPPFPHFQDGRQMICLRLEKEAKASRQGSHCMPSDVTIV